MEGTESARTSWVCAVCFEQYKERVRPARQRARDRTRIGVCSPCAFRAQVEMQRRADRGGGGHEGVAARVGELIAAEVRQIGRPRPGDVR